mgnify:CR=1 FL=1
MQHHNFYSNFTNSVKSGDDSMITNMVVNELSDLVVNSTTDLVVALNKVGIKANENLSDEELIDLILFNLPNNTNLLNALAFLIAEYNNAINKKGDKAEDSFKVVKGISDGLSSMSKEIGVDKVLRASIKKDTMEQIVTKSTAKGNYSRTIWKPTKSRKRLYWFLGGAAVLGITIFAVYQYKKSKKAGLALASMGLGIDGLPLPIVAPPIVTAPVFAQPQIVAPIVVAPPQPIISAPTSVATPMSMPIV